MKRGGPTHPKMFALMEALGVPHAQTVGLVEMLIHFASQHAPRGDVGKFPDIAIARQCGFDGDARTFIEALVKTGWLDVSAEHRLLVHDWNQHCDNTVKMFLRRQNLTFASGHKVPTRSKDDESSPVSGPYEDPAPSESPPFHNVTTKSSIPIPIPMPMPMPEDNGESVVLAKERDLSSSKQCKKTDLPSASATPEHPAFARVPPEFDERIPPLWDRFEAIRREANPAACPLTLTARRRYAVAEALVHFSIDELEAGFRWCMLSPSAKALAVRAKWSGIDTFLRDDKTAGYVEGSKEPDAWEAPKLEPVRPNTGAHEKTLERWAKGKGGAAHGAS